MTLQFELAYGIEIALTFKANINKLRVIQIKYTEFILKNRKI